MKATVQPLTAAAAAETKGRFAVFSELVKARLTVLVLVTTLVGYYLGSRGPLDWVRMLHAMLATALLAAGAAALNQYIERDFDARMRRTADRPLPGGYIQPQTALLFGALLSIGGLAYLLFATNPLTAFLGAITLAGYLFVYTPLKRRTVLNTLVGAAPGALPPLMGWTAAAGHIDPGGWSLFTILFFWQLPHFMAIAWLHREDYAGAGYRMLPVIDPDGFRTASAAVRHTIALLAFSLAPFVLKVAGPLYLAGALVLGLAFLAAAIAFARSLTRERARQLFFASIIYLPLLLGLLVVDKLRN